VQKDTTSEETLRAKRAFETYAGDRGITVQYYHADNAWVNSLDEEGQSIIYCGVNAHWQNGITERRIRDLKEQARTMMLHAQHHWPDANNSNLWPYALRIAGNIFNDAPQLKGDNKDCTPYEIFTGTRVHTEVRHHHTFDCPVFVTETAIQQGKSLGAWLSRAKGGLNLGISPTHARSVALVLSLRYGLSLPQFHVKHDNMFETTSSKAGRFRLPKSKWQALAGFDKPEPVADKGESAKTVVPASSTVTKRTTPPANDSTTGEADEDGIKGANDNTDPEPPAEPGESVFESVGGTEDEEDVHDYPDNSTAGKLNERHNTKHQTRDTKYQTRRPVPAGK
jgi:hypothetical protein